MISPALSSLQQTLNRLSPSQGVTPTLGDFSSVHANSAVGLFAGIGDEEILNNYATQIFSQTNITKLKNSNQLNLLRLLGKYITLGYFKKLSNIPPEMIEGLALNPYFGNYGISFNGDGIKIEEHNKEPLFVGSDTDFGKEIYSSKKIPSRQIPTTGKGATGYWKRPERLDENLFIDPNAYKNNFVAQGIGENPNIFHREQEIRKQLEQADGYNSDFALGFGSNPFAFFKYFKFKNNKALERFVTDNANSKLIQGLGSNPKFDWNQEWVENLLTQNPDSLFANGVGQNPNLDPNIPWLKELLNNAKNSKLFQQVQDNPRAQLKILLDENMPLIYSQSRNFKFHPLSKLVANVNHTFPPNVTVKKSTIVDKIFMNNHLPTGGYYLQDVNHRSSRNQS
jgi:hypothetical protein